MSSVQKRVVHVLSLSPASLTPTLTLLWCHPQCTHLSQLCNTATSCLGALGCQQAWPKCGPLTRNVGGRKMKEGGAELIEKEREGGKECKGKQGGIWGKEKERERVKEISELTQPWSKSRLPNPPASAVSLSLSISSCRQKGEEKHLRLNCPEVLLFLLFHKGKKWDPLLGLCTRTRQN